VQLNGEALSTLAAAPMVRRVEYQGVYYPMIRPGPGDHQRGDAWNRAGGASSAGDGVKVAVVDSASTPSTPASTIPGTGKDAVRRSQITNNKSSGEVFNNKTPSRGFTAEAIDSHGTHVAGTIGCNHDTRRR